MYLGVWQVGDSLPLIVNTHSPDSGNEQDADGSPTYAVYEQLTAAALLTGTLALFDDANTIGCYGAEIPLLSGNGFEAGKAYTVRIVATVESRVGVTFRTFQVEAAGGGAGGATADEIAAAVATRVLETGVTWEQALRGILGAAHGDVIASGNIRSTKSTDGTKTRATGTFDDEAGTRTVTARDLT